MIIRRQEVTKLDSYSSSAEMLSFKTRIFLRLYQYINFGTSSKIRRRTPSKSLSGYHSICSASNIISKLRRDPCGSCHCRASPPCNCTFPGQKSFYVSTFGFRDEKWLISGRAPSPSFSCLLVDRSNLFGYVMQMPNILSKAKAQPVMKNESGSRWTTSRCAEPA